MIKEDKSKQYLLDDEENLDILIKHILCPICKKIKIYHLDILMQYAMIVIIKQKQNIMNLYTLVIKIYLEDLLV